MYRAYLFAVTALLLVSAAKADQFVVKCVYNSSGEGGWVSKEAAYLIDTPTATMRVNDGIVRYANDDKALSTELEQPIPGVYVGRWTLELDARGNRRITVTYRVRIDEARGTAQISAIVGSSDTEPRAIARCTRKIVKR